MLPDQDKLLSGIRNICLGLLVYDKLAKLMDDLEENVGVSNFIHNRKLSTFGM